LHWNRRWKELNLRAYAGYSHGAPTKDYQLFLTNNNSSSFRPNYDYGAFNALAEASYDFGAPLQLDIGSDLELRRETSLYYTETFYKNANHAPLAEEDFVSGTTHYAYRQIGSYLQLHSAPFRDLPNFRVTGAARADWITFGPISYQAQTSFRGAIAHRF